MPDKFTVEIISPDQTILKQETNEVIIPSFEGQMGILNNHIPLITFLRPGIITIKAEGEKKYYAEEGLSLIHISEPTRPRLISYAVFCLKKKNKFNNTLTKINI